MCKDTEPTTRIKEKQSFEHVRKKCKESRKTSTKSRNTTIGICNWMKSKQNRHRNYIFENEEGTGHCGREKTYERLPRNHCKKISAQTNGAPFNQHGQRQPLSAILQNKTTHVGPATK